MDRPTDSSRFAGAGSSVRAALERSHLRSLPRHTKDDLMSVASLIHVPAGGTLHREGDRVPHLELVVSGLLRAYVTALDGRTLTVRYGRAGSILGAVSLFASPFSMPASVQAVTDAEVLALSAPSIAQAAERDVRIARALIDELSDRVMSFIAEIPGSAFATVRQRVARHLLDLASANQDGPELVVTISQQALADAVGSVREVVVRALRELRAEGWIDTGPHGMVLLDPEHLSDQRRPTGCHLEHMFQMGATQVADRPTGPRHSDPHERHPRHPGCPARVGRRPRCSGGWSGDQADRRPL